MTIASVDPTGLDYAAGKHTIAYTTVGGCKYATLVCNSTSKTLTPVISVSLGELVSGALTYPAVYTFICDSNINNYRFIADWDYGYMQPYCSQSQI